MGKFGDSIKREIGKNTGKFFSNLVFGDKHSTPYRRVSDAVQKQRIQAQIEKKERDDLNILDGAVLKNADIVLQTPIPHDEEGLVYLMSIWSAQLSGCKWDYESDEGKIRNQYPDALLEKYKQCSLMLKSVAPANAMMSYYDNILAQATKRRLRAKTKTLRMFAIYFAVLAAMIIICIILDKK